jgi:hypothetical protein
MADLAPWPPSITGMAVGIAVDSADSNLFVATDVVTRISLADCSVTRLNPIATGSVALDATRVYSVGPTGTVIACPQAGCGAGYATLASQDGGGSSGGAIGGGSGGAIAVDDAEVYWITPGQERIMKAGLDGGAPTELAAGSVSVNLGLTAGNVVYEGTSNSFGVLMSVTASGGTPAVRYTPDCTSVSTLTAVAGNAYFATYDGDVGQVSLATGAERTLGHGVNAVATALAADDSSLYWGIQSNAHPGTAIVTASLQGGALTTLASTLGTCGAGSVSGIAVDKNNVYFAAGTSLYKVAK